MQYHDELFATSQHSLNNKLGMRLHMTDVRKSCNNFFPNFLSHMSRIQPSRESIKSIYHELLQAMMQLSLILRTAAFFSNFTGAITAINLPIAMHFHTMSTYNLMIACQSYWHTYLWVGEIDDCSFSFEVLIYRIYTGTYFITRSIVP